MAFRNYFELDDVRLELPIGDKAYVIPPIGIPEGVEIETSKDIPDERFFELTLGTALAEMRADKVAEAAIVRAALTSMTRHSDGIELAEIMWETNALPERLAAYMAARLPQATTTESSTESDDKTPSPASTRPTSTPTRTRPNASARKPRATRGQKSSNTATSSKPTSPANTGSTSAG